MDPSHNELSQAQVDSYNKDGYLITKNVLTKEEIAELQKSCDELVQRAESQNGPLKDATWQGDWNKNKQEDSKVISIHNVQNHSTFFAKLLFNAKLTKYASQLIPGGNVALHHTKFHEKPAGKGSPFPMHQDYPYFPHKKDSLIAIIVHVDKSTVANGCLCVMPGSHKEFIADATITAPSGHNYLDPEKYPISKAIPVEMEAGDILFLSYKTVHGSYANTSETERRRILLLQVQDPTDEPLKDIHLSPGRGLMLYGSNPTPILAKRGGGH
jgi:ectoine hydroxylase-related dioxygenase (phytanoyl-CoA dioxygenase family)